MMFNKERKNLPWSWAEKRLTDSRNYWLITGWPDGRPHTMPVWGVWVQNSFFFSTGASSRKAKNLRVSPNCLVVPDGAAEAVVLEGLAKPCSDSNLLRECMRTYKRKYHWDLKGAKDPIYKVMPLSAFGVSENLTGTKGNPTRWKFGKKAR